MDQLEDSASSHEHGPAESQGGNSGFEDELGFYCQGGFEFDTLFVVIFFFGVGRGFVEFNYFLYYVFEYILNKDGSTAFLDF